jgi:hypothetical protein
VDQLSEQEVDVLLHEMMGEEVNETERTEEEVIG